MKIKNKIWQKCVAKGAVDCANIEFKSNKESVILICQNTKSISISVKISIRYIEHVNEDK